MKPNEILGMVEEACGTRLYEMKKLQAQKTMEKKASKVHEITKILEEGRAGAEKRRRHHSDTGEAAEAAQRVSAVGVELDGDRASPTPGDGVRVLGGARDVARRRHGEPTDRGGVESVRRDEAIGGWVVATLSPKTERSEMESNLAELKSKREEASGGALEELNKQEATTSKELVRANSSYVNELAALDREKQEIRVAEERIRASEASASELTSRVRVGEERELQTARGEGGGAAAARGGRGTTACGGAGETHGGAGARRRGRGNVRVRGDDRERDFKSPGSP